MFRRVAMVCAAVLAGVVPVRALADGDAHSAGAHSWSGFYAGVTAGYAWGDVAYDINTDPIASNNLTPAGRATFANLGSGNSDLDGFIGGAGAGYNHQSGSIVLGLEADISGFSGDGDRTAVGTADVPGVAIPATFRDSFDIDWLATIRARAGIAEGRTLFYATAGLAIADVNFRREIFVPGDGCPSTPCHSGRQSETLTGWTVGAGVEHALSGNWSLKAEYLFVDLSDDLDFSTDSTVFAGQTLSHAAEIEDLHILRAGLNYRF